MTGPEALKYITDFSSLVAYLRDELEWEIPENLPLDSLTYSYTADELGLKLDAQVEITQLRPILGQENAWGVFFVDFDKSELPVTLLRRILSSVSRRKRASANPADRVLFDKNDLLFVSAFGKAEDRRLALAHFHQELGTTALPTLRILTWDKDDTPRHMKTVADRLDRLRWPGAVELAGTLKARWAGAFVDRPRDAIRTAREMAQALAECAKQIRRAIEEILPREKAGEPLTKLFEAVKETLNRDLDVPKFADTYAQTIAYGLLSKRIDQVQRWRSEKSRTMDGDLPLPPITADALETAIPTNPFLSELLTSFMSAVGRDAGGSVLDFDELGLGDLVDLLNTANMEAVLDDFDKDKQGDDPVIHFYEGFLAAYDKAMKVQRGVFYTPKPVVSFIVRSVDEVLRAEFGLVLGLADTTTWSEFVKVHPEVRLPEGVKPDEPFVNVLDPATGTGTFLVEVIDLIWRRMTEEAWRGKPAEEKRRLWNAYVAEHLLPRLYGYELMMAPYAVAHLKIGLKLADTGYDFSGLETGPDGEARPMRARVFLTNALEPAQDLDMQLAFMNQALAQEARAANDAKTTGIFTVVLGNPPYSNFNTGATSKYIGALLQPYKTGVTERKLNLDDDFIKFYAMVQKGLLPAVGTAVVGLITSRTFVDGLTHRGMRREIAFDFNYIHVVDLHGSLVSNTSTNEPADENVFDIKQGVAISILAKIGDKTFTRYKSVVGSRTHKYSFLDRADQRVGDIINIEADEYRFRQNDVSPHNEYAGFIPIDRIFNRGSSGVQTKRDALFVAISADELAARMRVVLGNELTEEIRTKYDLEPTAGWSPECLRRARFDPSLILPYQYRPLDTRYIYYDPALLGRAREAVLGHMVADNLAISTLRQTVDSEFRHVLAINSLCDLNLTIGHHVSDQVFPLYVYNQALVSERQANLDSAAVAIISPDIARSPAEIFGFIYGVLHSASYRARYADRLKRAFPRIPVPGSVEVFSHVEELGTRLVALHLLDADSLPELLVEPKVRFISNGGEARLGRFNKEVRRDAAGRVYLNDQNWFATVPDNAWNHWIGGYQPAQKWLKDRSETGSKDKLKPGRLLTDEDIVHYRGMIVALEETGNVMSEIDRVIDQHGGWPGAFRGMSD